MKNDQIDVMTREERAFLHEIASPLGSAVLMLDIVIESARSRPESEKTLKELKMTQKALERMKELLQSRREILIQRGSKND